MDISSVFSRKEQMLACHESQRAFLGAQQGISDTLAAMGVMAERAGRISGFGKAEGFRQHLGQGFPQDNLLAKLLGERVRSVELR